MSIDWRMKVYDATFTIRTQPGAANNIITKDMGVASLDTFDVDAAGNCLEASFKAVPAFVDIQLRDVIILEISTDSGSTWTAKYRGYVVTCGNPRSKSIQTYKLVGLKQRFYEKIVQLNVVDGDDVATMVNDIFDDLVSESDLPSGVSTTGEDIPILSFLQGDRYPRLETVGDALDALAETVGAFVVPTGSTYTYDGVTYYGGDTVPAVIWFVKADGTFCFRRPQQSSVTVSESDAQTLVQFDEITAEDVVSDVCLLYASELQSGPFTLQTLAGGTGLAYRNTNDIAFVPLRRVFQFGGNGSTKVIVVEDPVFLMSNQVNSVTTTGTVTNSGNVNDGDAGTFATITSGSITVDKPASQPNDGFIMRVRLESTSTSATGFVRAGLHQWSRVFAASGDVIDVYLPALPDVDSGTGIDEYTVSGTNLKVYLMQLFVPDVDANGTLSEEYANGFVRQPTLDVATIRQVGTLGAVTQTIDFTPDGETARDVPVERISYALTTNNGLVTTYHVGQAYEAELLSERAVLEALAKRATR